LSAKTELTLFGVGEIPAEYAARVLTYVEDAYDGFWIADQICTMASEDVPTVVQSLCSTWISTPRRLPFATSSESLKLKRVVLQSPGFWGFVGALNPLESLRKYLNDRFERIQKQAVAHIKEERLYLENEDLRWKIAEKAIKVMKAAEIDALTRAAFVRDYILVPICRLESLQDRNIISVAEIPRLEHSALDEGNAEKKKVPRKSPAKSVLRNTKAARQKTDA
jgi:hypothetical protein